MPLKTYTGSCHCGAVRLEAEIDLAAGTGRCNCSYCAKVRNWSALVKPEAFRLLAGEDALGAYRFSPESPNHHLFCRHCGVRCFSRGYVEEIGGAYCSVSVACLDGVDDQELAAAPITYFDGRADDWFSTPKVTKHL